MDSPATQTVRRKKSAASPFSTTPTVSSPIICRLTASPPCHVCSHPADTVAQCAHTSAGQRSIPGHGASSQRRPGRTTSQATAVGSARGQGCRCVMLVCMCFPAHHSPPFSRKRDTPNLSCTANVPKSRFTVLCIQGACYFRKVGGRWGGWVVGWLGLANVYCPFPARRTLLAVAVRGLTWAATHEHI